MKKGVIIGIGIAIAIALAVGIFSFPSTPDEASTEVGIKEEAAVTIKTPEEEPTPLEIIVDAVEDVGVESEPELEEEEPTPLEIIVDAVESVGIKDKEKQP